MERSAFSLDDGFWRGEIWPPAEIQFGILERHRDGVLLPEGQAAWQQGGLLLVDPSVDHRRPESVGTLAGAGEAHQEVHGPGRA